MKENNLEENNNVENQEIKIIDKVQINQIKIDDKKKSQESEDLKLISLQSSPCCQYDHQQDKKEGCACFIRYIKMHGHLSFMP